MKRNYTRLLTLVLAIGASVIAPTTAKAELYSYTDKDGDLVLTNVPPQHLKSRQHSLNTFDWTDDLGVLRRVHRVNITQFDSFILEAAAHYTLPAALIKAVTAVESSFEPTAISPAGAQGLMQLMPATGREMLVGDPFDPRANIFGGTRYLRILTNRFHGDVEKTIAAYNAGPKAVTKYQGIPNYPETQRYVRRVLKLYRHYLRNW